MMRRAIQIGLVVMVVGLAVAAVAQTGTDQNAATPQNAPAPAYGPTTADVVANPPITALDAPSLEPNIQPRSMLIGGLQASESLDSNVNSEANTSQLRSITRLLGGLTMQRLWSRYNFGAAYVGGVAFYPQVSPLVRNIQEVQVQQGVSWKTGQLMIRDSFSYLPEGSFGFGSFGGSTGFQLGLGGLGAGNGLMPIGLGGHYGIIGNAQYGLFGQTPLINNVTVVDAVQALSPRSSVTLAGSYGLVHFTDNNPGSFINSDQIGAQAGYNYSLTPRDQIGVAYGYRQFQFPSDVGADNISSHVVQVLYGHRISGRMDFVIGAGPQWTVIHNPLQHTKSISGSGTFLLRYRFPRTTVALSFASYDTVGSGFFAGAESQIARATINHEIKRRWEAIGDLGVAHNRRLQDAALGVDANSFSYLFVGAGVRRAFNRNLGAFVSYQFNLQEFNGLACTGSGCSTAQRHVVTFGADWHFRPIRLD
jgi:hypothetical protein